MRAERGHSIAVEAVLILPALMLVIALVVLGGRVAMAKQALDSAAAEGARAASIARTSAEAVASSKLAVDASLAAHNVRCVSKSVTVDASQLSRGIGVSASTTTRVTCVVSLSDLFLPGTPGSVTLTAERTSPIDSYRSR